MDTPDLTVFKCRKIEDFEDSLSIETGLQGQSNTAPRDSTTRKCAPVRRGIDHDAVAIDERRGFRGTCAVLCRSRGARWLFGATISHISCVARITDTNRQEKTSAAASWGRGAVPGLVSCLIMCDYVRTKNVLTLSMEATRRGRARHSCKTYTDTHA